MRSFAFLIDALFLFALLAAPFLVAPDLALRLAPVATWWQLALAFAYFAAMNGPVGRGQTFGKMALDIRTVRALDAAPIAWPAALRRTALQLLPFIVIFCVVELLAPWRLRPDFAPRAAHILGTQTGLALLAAHIACLIMSPHVRGLHDRAAETVTAREPIGGLFRETVAAAADDATRLLERRAWQTSAFVAFVVIGMGGCDMGRERALLAHPISQGRLALNEEVGDAATIAGVAPEVRWIATVGLPGDDGITTASLQLAYRVRGVATPDLIAGAEQGLVRLLDLVEHDPARVRDLYFLDRAAEGSEPRVRTDAQYRRATLLVEEVYPVLTMTAPLTRRERHRASRDVRLPPDAMIRLAPPPATGDDPAAPSPAAAPPAVSPANVSPTLPQPAEPAASDPAAADDDPAP